MNIWFNRWFSTAYHYINMLKENTDNKEVTVFGTHPDANAVYLQACDHASVEPDIEGNSYIDFCLDFCEYNKINVFFPRKEMVLISENIEKFEKIGTKVVVCSDSELMKKIDNKAWMYEELQGKGIVEIPDYTVVNNAADFKEAVLDLQSKGHRACFKPVIGEGGFGFRVIDEIAAEAETLFGPINHKISLDYAVELLSKKETFPDIMVLEYLDGFEYSIDCIAKDGVLVAAVPRRKVGGRVRHLEDNKELIEIAEKIVKAYNIPYVFNIQVKYKDGIPKLLEINPRMSGGLHITCLSGINFPYEALKIALGEEVKPLVPKLDIYSTYVEKPCVLE